MKISENQNVFLTTNKQPQSTKGTMSYAQKKLPQAPSFTGGADTLVKFWEAVDRGGLVASFTIQDMLGTNIPRTVAAKDIGKEFSNDPNYVNWTAVAENGLREFLTGPSMFAVPAGVLYGAMKHFGPAHGVDIKSINDMATILKSNPNAVKADNITDFKKTFYTDVMNSVFENFDNKKAPINVDDYVDKIIQMEQAKSKGLVNKLKNVPNPNSKEDILESIIHNFISDKKANTKGYPNFLSARLLEESKETDVAKVFDKMDKFARDAFESFKKSGTESVDEFIDNFTTKRMGGRFVTNVAMGAATAAAMWFIPKIYSIGKSNPETAALKDWSKTQQSQLQGGAQKTQGENKEAQADKQVAFTGRGDFLMDIGKKVAPDADLSKFADSIESDWINVAKPIFYSLITGFTLVPRVIQSTKRDVQSAKDTGQKNDWTETKNILRRDVTTIATILFAMKGLSAIMAQGATKKTGTILTNNPHAKDNNFLKKAFAFFKPEGSKGSIEALSNKTNIARLSNFKSADEISRLFTDTVEKGGDLHKMMTFDKGKGESFLYNAAKELFGDIIEKKDIGAKELNDIMTSKEGTEAFSNFMGVLNDTKKNPLLKFAGKTSAVFNTISLGIVAGFLGFGLPKINAAINKKEEEKKLEAMKQSGVQNPTLPQYEPSIIDTPVLSHLNEAQKHAFKDFIK